MQIFVSFSILPLSSAMLHYPQPKQKMGEEREEDKKSRRKKRVSMAFTVSHVQCTFVRFARTAAQRDEYTFSIGR